MYKPKSSELIGPLLILIHSIGPNCLYIRKCAFTLNRKTLTDIFQLSLPFESLVFVFLNTFKVVNPELIKSSFV